MTAVGPFGDFHIKDTLKEMIYIGGGAGMAPLRAHLSHLPVGFAGLPLNSPPPLTAAAGTNVALLNTGPQLF